MRRKSLVLTMLVLFALSVRAQQTPPVPPPMPVAPVATEADKKLDGYLQQWAKKMQEIVTLSAKLERTNKDKTFQSEQKYTGSAQYMKVGTGPTVQNLALLEMKVAGKQDIHEKIICTGTFIYQFAPADQKIYATEIPTPKSGQVGQDSFLTLVLGANSADLRNRYDLKLADDPTLHPKGEDKFYIYVDVLPKLAADKADFQRAQLVLNKDTFLLRRLWFEAPNKSETLWDITSIDDKAKVKREDFDAPKPPPGWKLVPVEKNSELPPRIIRPNN